MRALATLLATTILLGTGGCAKDEAALPEDGFERAIHCSAVLASVEDQASVKGPYLAALQRAKALGEPKGLGIREVVAETAKLIPALHQEMAADRSVFEANLRACLIEFHEARNPSQNNRDTDSAVTAEETASPPAQDEAERVEELKRKVEALEQDLSDLKKDADDFTREVEAATPDYDRDDPLGLKSP